MLFQIDRNELGDKRLDPKENVARQREELLKKASQYKVEDQAELQNPDRATTGFMAYTDLITRLQKIVPNLVAKEGHAESLALYCPRTAEQLEAAIREGSGGSGKDLFFLFNKYIGGVPKRELPEWGYVDIDTSLVATREHLRGWRTILIGLIRAGVLSYGDAVKEFGDPTNDTRSIVWMKKLLEWKQNPTKQFTLRDVVAA